MSVTTKKVQRQKRHFRARKKIHGCSERPRLSVYRSNKHIEAQIINDVDSKTICTASSASKDLKGQIKGYDTAGAQIVGKSIAEKAKANGIETIVFDCGGNRYHGRVKALAEAARKAGLKF
jgi:large subunit ribosomal protein L18